ncbi:DUF433 domain-containing protein [Silvibacterium sp.]|uniref:DUF433 domain-containing protein n=1 Tax=Silvibacterium sp. TaxID=1964179 RepID=UPI0039E63ED0
MKSYFEHRACGVKIIDMDWSGCELVEVVPGKVSGAPLLKGTRLPAETLIENVQAYMDDGQLLEEAILSTLESFPSTPGGAGTIRALFAYSESQDLLRRHQPAL